MAYPWTAYKTWTTGEVLTAADLNNSFSSVITNSIPANIDDYSTNSSVMGTTTDPYPAAAVSLPTALAGELEHIRYMIKQITGKSQWYVDAAAIGSKGADVNSATSPLPVLTDGNFFDVTGTSAISEIATLGVGSVIFLQFDAASSLTHHNTNLILPGATNITNAAGDVACFIEYAAGDWFLVSHSGLALHRGAQTITGVKTLTSSPVIAPTTDIDAYATYTISGGISYTVGSDTSDGDSFVISRGSTLGTNNALRADGTTGAIAIRGTTTNDSGAAGFVGEIISATQTATNAPTSTEFGDLTSISLTAGDWDVNGLIAWDNNGATWTDCRIGISSTSGNNATGLATGDNSFRNTHASSATTPVRVSQCISGFRVSLTSTTTYYLKYASTYSAGGPPTAAGRLSARRVR
jgi:hypothetical protein